MSFQPVRSIVMKLFQSLVLNATTLKGCNCVVYSAGSLEQLSSGFMWLALPSKASHGDTLWRETIRSRHVGWKKKASGEEKVYLFIYPFIHLFIYLFIKNDSHHLDYYFSFLKSLNAACFTNRRGFLWDFHMEIQIKTCRPLGLILFRLVRPFHRNTSGDTHWLMKNKIWFMLQRVKKKNPFNRSLGNAQKHMLPPRIQWLRRKSGNTLIKKKKKKW